MPRHRGTLQSQRPLPRAWATPSFAIVAGGCAIAAWSSFSTDGWLVWATCFFGWTLLALAAIDIRRFLLPDAITLPLLLSGLVVAYLIDPSSILRHLIGAVAGFVSFMLFSSLYRRLRGREGLGHGDAKLMAALGAWLSWQGLPSVVLIGASSALAVALLQVVAGTSLRWDHRLPFGAYLALGGWMVWLNGPVSLTWVP
jgi:leader peptidase (prepilin peptidase)/N-methyltransferase